MASALVGAKITVREATEHEDAGCAIDYVLVSEDGRDLLGVQVKPDTCQPCVIESNAKKQRKAAFPGALPPVQRAGQISRRSDRVDRPGRASFVRGFFFGQSTLQMLLSFLPVFAYTVAIAGVRGGLGRELAAQSIDRGCDVVGIVREDVTSPVMRPCRIGWLDELVPNTTPLTGVHLTTAPTKYDALVLAMSGKPFAPDDAHRTTRALLATLPDTCTDVVLVSAHGVGDSIENANAGIRLMRSVYLRSTYASKQIQEELVRALPVRTRILRPKVLSYGAIPFNTIATTREALARDILDHLP